MDSSKISGKYIALTVFFIARQLVAATAGFEVLVLDADTDEPINGVDVVGWFDNNNGWKAWTEAAPIYDDNKTTDKNGRCHVKGETNTGETGVNIHNPPKGYYPNSFCVRQNFTQKPLLPLMQWRPTDLVITALLYRIERPVPLFVKKASLGNGHPITEKVKGVFSYDLVKGAWMPPIGNGDHADVEFEILPRQMLGEAFNPGRGTRGFSFREPLAVRFAGEDNGIIEMKPRPNSAFMIRTAPTSGYKKSYECWYGLDSNLQRYDNTDENRCFCFRIRSRKGEDGKIVETYYGKIYGDIQTITGRGDLYGLSFVYYLNLSPNDRNLEWDMKNNLAPGSAKKHPWDPSPFKERP